MNRLHKTGMSHKMNRLGTNTGFGGAGQCKHIAVKPGAWKFPGNCGSEPSTFDPVQRFDNDTPDNAVGAGNRTGRCFAGPDGAGDDQLGALGCLGVELQCGRKDRGGLPDSA